MTQEELKAIGCTPIEELIAEDFGELGTPERTEFELREVQGTGGCTTSKEAVLKSNLMRILTRIIMSRFAPD